MEPSAWFDAAKWAAKRYHRGPWHPEHDEYVSIALVGIAEAWAELGSSDKIRVSFEAVATTAARHAICRELARQRTWKLGGRVSRNEYDELRHCPDQKSDIEHIDNIDYVNSIMRKAGWKSAFLAYQFSSGYSISEIAEMHEIGERRASRDINGSIKKMSMIANPDIRVSNAVAKHEGPPCLECSTTGGSCKNGRAIPERINGMCRPCYNRIRNADPERKKLNATAKVVLRRKKKRLRMYQEQDGICFMCGVLMIHPDDVQAENNPRNPTFEHLKPRCLGGKNDKNNLMLSCQKCNHSRGNDPDYHLADIFLQKTIEHDTK